MFTADISSPLRVSFSNMYQVVAHVFIGNTQLDICLVWIFLTDISVEQQNDEIYLHIP